MAQDWNETQRFHREALLARYVVIPSQLEWYTVPREMAGEIPLVIVWYGCTMLNDSSSLFWAVFMAEWPAIAAKGILWSASDESCISFLKEIDMSYGTLLTTGCWVLRRKISPCLYAWMDWTTWTGNESPEFKDFGSVGALTTPGPTSEEHCNFRLLGSL